jgi:hypothetical protein
MRFLIAILVFILFSLNAPAFAATCLTPAPTGCADSNTSVSSSVTSVMGGASPFSQIDKGCCSCSNVEKMLADVFDSLRQNFILGSFHDEYFAPAMTKSFGGITSQLLGNAALVGNVIEGQTNIQSIQNFQSASSEILTSHQSSEALCRFASLGKSLAADDVKRRAQQLLFSEVGLARSLGTEGAPAASGAVGDVAARLNMFITEFCDKESNNNGLGLMCNQAGSVFGSGVNVKNADLNFAQVISLKPTLDIDLTDQFTGVNSNGAPNNLTPDEESVIAMSYNLYGHKTIAPRFGETELESPEGQQAYIKIRTLLAGRALASNSFYAFVTERATGTGAALPHMKALLNEMGVSAADAEKLIGLKPSYYAQMNLLTRSLYQNTNFYGTLMEGKTNVTRQSAYMDSIDLMQDRDLYNSSLRTELLLSSLIELETRERAKELVDGLSK